MIKINKGIFNGFEGFFIVNNEIEVFVATDIPYILKYNLKGKENLFYLDKSLSGKTFEDKWVNYGGHRLWTSPEKEGRANEPDSFKQEYEILKNGIKITQNKIMHALTQKSITVTIEEKGSSVKLLHEIKNLHTFPVELAAWSLSVMKAGGVLKIRQIDTDTGFLPNRQLVLWPYSKLNDERLSFDEKNIYVRQDKNSKSPFKFGVLCNEKKAYYYVDSQVFIKSFPCENDAKYPDYGCNFESYTNANMIEIEALSPLRTLDENETVTLNETWEINDNISI